MGRQYFADTVAEVNVADFTAVVATTETRLFPATNCTIPAWGNVGGPAVGKIYQLLFGGIVSTSASASTLTITPRIGTSISGTTLGASTAQTVTVSLTNVPFDGVFTFAIRAAANNDGSSCTVVGTGHLSFTGAAATAGSADVVTFGGTTATVDFSNASQLVMGWTLSVAGSVTPKTCIWRALN